MHWGDDGSCTMIKTMMIKDNEKTMTMTIMLIMVTMIKTTMIKENDKTRPARPLCPNHQNFPSHSNATPQMLPQKKVFLVEQFFPLNHCVRSERLNWCHKNSFLAPQIFPTDIFFCKHVTVVPTIE